MFVIFCQQNAFKHNRISLYDCVFFNYYLVWNLLIYLQLIACGKDVLPTLYFSRNNFLISWIYILIIKWVRISIWSLFRDPTICIAGYFSYSRTECSVFCSVTLYLRFIRATLQRNLIHFILVTTGNPMLKKYHCAQLRIPRWWNVTECSVHQLPFVCRHFPSCWQFFAQLIDCM